MAQPTMPSPDESSYPPPFRRPTSPSAAVLGVPVAPPALPVSFSTVHIPVIDLQALDPGALAAACEDWGVFRLTNHGTPPALSRRLHDEVRRVFSLPFETKRARFAGPPATYFFGTPAVSLVVRDLNWLEGIHVPLDRPPPCFPGGDPDLGEDACLRDLTEEYGRHSARVVKALFESLAAEIGFDGERRASYLSDSDRMLRLFFYPHCPHPAGKYLGINAHTDSSVLTTVSEDEVGGLQVLRDGTWFSVKPVAGTLVVIVGDMLQAMSDDRCRSSEHRVLASSGRERISICYFAFPCEEGAIVSSKYRKFTNREFREKVQEDIRSVGFKYPIFTGGVDPIFTGGVVLRDKQLVLDDTSPQIVTQ
ncbi:hypothetical protein Taro_013509 [Colocasia esculenta]|uniref:Fe2OG dioxygenase domain-containing protein n=1 Tax=Colocasia esculenta TaxID=4460 RepID=A0A843U6S0_COLES|nr:hypothetical protein [Colocasia esculenta]